MLLTSLNHNLDHSGIDLLHAIHRIETVDVSGDCLLLCASLVAAGFVDLEEHAPGHGHFGSGSGLTYSRYTLTLSTMERLFIEAWRKGDQAGAVAASNVGAYPTQKKGGHATPLLESFPCP